MKQSKPQAESKPINESVLKKGLFLGITVFFPVLFFAGLELALRWFDYGVDLSLFQRTELHGTSNQTVNPNVSSRYFGGMKFRPSTSIHYFLVPKKPGTYRIFCLGGSTTVGYPYYFNASFPTFLADRLRAIFPEKKIEVINLGMTATNSFTALDMGRELAPYEPDLIIDYDGHNEFYGALGAASNQTISSSRGLTLFYLRLVHFRSFQLMQNVIRSIAGVFVRGGTSVPRGTIMEQMAFGQYVSSGDGRYQEAYENFRANLLDLREYCRSNNIPLILGTQVSNLRDLPPFVSEHSRGLLQDKLTFFRREYEGGKRFQSIKAFDSAVVAFRSAVAVDSTYADAHYRLAQCLGAVGNNAEALDQYTLARDFDVLRFRTDTRFNNLIRSVADDSSCFGADVVKAFKAASPDSLIGRNLIMEHLHPNSRGAFAMALCYVNAMRSHHLLASGQEWTAADTLNEERLWENRSVTDLDEHMAAQATAILTSGWPFSEETATIPDVSPSDTFGLIARDILIHKIDWRRGHQEAIDVYKKNRALRNIEREYFALISEIPHDLSLYLDLTALYLQQKRFDDMRNTLLRSLDVYPTVLAYRTLGDIEMNVGNPRGAVKYYERMNDFEQRPEERLQNQYALCLAYAQSGEFQKAQNLLTEVLRVKPDYPPALQLRNDINRRLGRN